MEDELNEEKALDSLNHEACFVPFLNFYVGHIKCRGDHNEEGY